LANTTNYICLKNGVSSKFLCRVLNSELIEWRFRVTSTNNHVNTYDLDALPFPKQIDQELEKKMNELVEEMLQINKKLSLLVNKETDEKKTLDERMQSLDMEINDLVFQIYRIEEHEKNIIMNKT